MKVTVRANITQVRLVEMNKIITAEQAVKMGIFASVKSAKIFINNNYEKTAEIDVSQLK